MTRFVDGLVDLDIAATRARLADAMRVCREQQVHPSVAVALAEVQRALLATARNSILTLQDALDEAAAAPLAIDHLGRFLAELDTGLILPRKVGTKGDRE